MIEPDAEWPTGPVDVDRPTPWPPEQQHIPPSWPKGSDPEYVYLEATWGDRNCVNWIDDYRKFNAGIAVDGQHRDLATFAGGAADD